MNIITVAPIKRGIPVNELSYFTREDVAPGSLVSVPLRGKITPALVIHSAPASLAKADIKQAGFSLKKLESVHSTKFFRPAFIEACRITAEYYATSTGAVIQAVFPNSLLLSKKIAWQRDDYSEKQSRLREQYIFQADDSERLATYKSHIREVFARGKSCYFILPSIQDIEQTYASLEKGIREYTFILHSDLGKKEIERRWKKIVAMDHPVLIIGTPLFLGIGRNDIESIILEKESSGTYTLQGRPFLDLRFFVEQFSKAINSDLIFGDLFLRVETLHRKDSGKFESLIRPKYRLPSTAENTIVDMRASGEQPATGRIAIFSAELVARIEEIRAKGTHCFILGIRRGFAPMTVCGDCGTIVSCTRCSAPMVLHQKNSDTNAHEKQKKVFLCHRCGNEGDTDITCSHCGGWRLVPLGIGITQAHDILKKRFPDAKIFRIDHDSVRKHEEAVVIIQQFYSTPGSILLGTEMAIPYLTEPLAVVGVLSVNSLLTIPDFRIGEKIFRLLLVLREKARDHFIVQTRDPDMQLFYFAASGNIGEFLKTELDARHNLGYPPFTTLIKFTYEGKKADGTAMMAEIEKIFGVYHPVVFPSFIARVKEKYRMNALLKIPEGRWPDKDIIELIRALPPEVDVRINPESVI